ncbi:MAG: ligase-associated DNA damage response endonuclease PdeM [Planctomycetota bacterium]
MNKQIEIEVKQTKLTLRDDGSIFVPAWGALLVADLHLGKERSFRAGGIPVPDGPSAATLELLSDAIRRTECQQVIFLGDLIHDGRSLSPELIEDFATMRSCWHALSMHLVRGNHDRHVSIFPASWDLQVHQELEVDSVTLVHAAPEEIAVERYYLEGHWHPVTIVGRGADQMRVRCFVDHGNRLTLPAFGPFKGGMKIHTQSARVYPILPGAVLGV